MVTSVQSPQNTFIIAHRLIIGTLYYTSCFGAMRRYSSTCVDLAEHCKKATSIHFLSHKKVKSKQRKQNLYYHVQLCSLQTITKNCADDD